MPEEAVDNDGAAATQQKMQDDVADFREAEASATAQPKLGGSLAEMMRRRREVCEEFESTPMDTTADFGTARASAYPATGPTADVGSTCRYPTKAAEAASALETPEKADDVAKLADADAAYRPRIVRHTNDDELHKLMEEMRGRCQVLESTQEPSSTDAQANDPADRGGALQPKGELEADAEDAGRSKVVRRSAKELRDWMTQMRNRCEELESTPEVTTADARNEDAATYGGNAGDSLSIAADPEPGLTKTISSTARRGASKEAAVATLAPNDFTELRLKVREGVPLPHDMRSNVWGQILPAESSAQEEKGRAGAKAKPPPALVRLLGANSMGDVGEQVLFDAGDEAGTKPEFGLAAAFTEKHLAWLRADQSLAGSTSIVFNVIAQLLRYHCPSAAMAIESTVATPKGAPDGMDFASVLSSACDGADGLAGLLFTPRRDEADALRLLCDITVLEEEDMLLLLVVVVLFAEAAADFVKESDRTLQKFRQRLRGEGPDGAGARSTTAGARRCAAAARARLATTPVSLLRSAVLDSDEAKARIRPPMCVVNPDEVLHHTYERPSGSWRLVVVDVRMRSSELMLPVSMRLGQAQHNHRRQLLRDMPYEDSIHLCLMGDGPPAPGEDAFELCRHLVGPPSRRKHVSVVEGGWPAVQELAESLRLDLMPVEPEVAAGIQVGAAAVAVARGVHKQAKATVADFADQVASATESTTAVAQKVAGSVASATETVSAVGQRAASRVFAGMRDLIAAERTAGGST
mmetsp:Transcript_13776/g.37310  ORF Transcript_13776/g.37310 Transcript_13776/m.37310 type:complete len:754 (+) Transcript_13776:105-2366(+)